MIVTGWGLSFMKNWEHTVLSRIKTREGLFLLEPVDPNKTYGPTEQFRRFVPMSQENTSSYIAYTIIEQDNRV
jgi:hypothetical protein